VIRKRNPEFSQGGEENNFIGLGKIHKTEGTRPANSNKEEKGAGSYAMGGILEKKRVKRKRVWCQLAKLVDPGWCRKQEGTL